VTGSLGESNVSSLREGSFVKSFARLIALAAVVAGIALASPHSADAGHGLLSRLCAKDACAPECAPVCAPVCVPVCAPAPVCPPPPVFVTICVKDPCTCCTQEVSVCVPACCACETPCLDSCRPGFLGRKVLTYKFPGCGHCVEIVLTKHGKAIVRG